MENIQNTTTLREALNTVRIEGWLKKKEVKQGTGKKGATLSIDMVVATSPTNEIAVHSYANELTNAGGVNSAFNGLMTIATEYVSIADLMKNGVSKEDAWNQCTKVSIRDDRFGGRLTRNEYYTQSGTLSSRVRVDANYINRVDESKGFAPDQLFTVEMFMDKIAKEVKGGDMTGRLLIKGIVPMYDGTVLPYDFIVPTSIADDFERCYTEKRTAKLWGNIVNTVTTAVVRESGFGEARESETSTYLEEMVIVGGTGEMIPESSINNYTPQQIAAAMNVRVNEYLPSKLAESQKRKSAPGQGYSAGGFSANAGFGGQVANPALAAAAKGFTM